MDRKLKKKIPAKKLQIEYVTNAWMCICKCEIRLTWIQPAFTVNHRHKARLKSYEKYKPGPVSQQKENVNTSTIVYDPTSSQPLSPPPSNTHSNFIEATEPNAQHSPELGFEDKLDAVQRLRMWQ